MAYNPEEWLNDDIRYRPRSRSAKWWLLVGMSVAVGGVIWAPFYPLGGGDEPFPSLPAMLLVGIGLYTSTFSRDYWLTDKAKYDEHEKLVLAQSTQMAYPLMMLFLLLWAGWCWLGTTYGFVAPSRGFDFRALFIAILFGGAALPVLIAEWTLPLPKEREED